MSRSRGSIFAPAAQAQASADADAAAQAVTVKKVRNPQKVFVLTPEQADQLDSLCFHSKMTIQAVVIEGINLVLKSKGLPALKD